MKNRQPQQDADVPISEGSGEATLAVLIKEADKAARGKKEGDGLSIPLLTAMGVWAGFGKPLFLRGGTIFSPSPR